MIISKLLRFLTEHRILPLEFSIFLKLFLKNHFSVSEPVADLRFLPYSNALVAIGKKNIYLIDFERLPGQCNPKFDDLTEQSNDTYMSRVVGMFSHRLVFYVFKPYSMVHAIHFKVVYS